MSNRLGIEHKFPSKNRVNQHAATSPVEKLFGKDSRVTRAKGIYRVLPLNAVKENIDAQLHAGRLFCLNLLNQTLNNLKVLELHCRSNQIVARPIGWSGAPR